jgi:hypothetical protein
VMPRPIFAAPRAPQVIDRGAQAVARGAACFAAAPRRYLISVRAATLSQQEKPAAPRSTKFDGSKKARTITQAGRTHNCTFSIGSNSDDLLGVTF